MGVRRICLCGGLNGCEAAIASHLCDAGGSLRGDVPPSGFLKNESKMAAFGAVFLVDYAAI